MFRAFMLTKRDAARANIRDGHLSNAVKQGHAHRQQRPSACATTDPALVSTVRIDPLSITCPDASAHGCLAGSLGTLVGSHLWGILGLGRAHVGAQEVAHVHDPRWTSWAPT